MFDVKIVHAASYPVSIFMAGDLSDAERVCREYCDESGFCVTVTATNYIYTRGEEDGFIVGLINYPRFPRDPEIIWNRAERLAATLCDNLSQQSYTIQAPDKTVWFSHRAEDNASVAGAREGQDPKGLEARPARTARRVTPNLPPNPPHPQTKERDCDR